MPINNIAPSIVRAAPRRLVRALLACAPLLVPAALAAQRQPLPLVRPAQPPREEYSPRVEVGSPGIVVGLEVIGSPGDLPIDRLVVYLPADRGRDSLCVSVRSIDGRYRGAFQFAVHDAPGRTVLLDVSSRRYAPRLAAYTADRLAVGAWLAPSCAAPPESFVVVGRSSAARGGTLRLSLNADAGLLVRAEITASGQALPSTRCPLLEVDEAHAYNRVCTIPLPAGSGRHGLQLTLRVPGEDPKFALYSVRAP